MDSKEGTCVILINHASPPIRKEKLSPSNKVRRKARQNKHAKSGWANEIKSKGKVDSSRDHPRARLELVKTIQNGRVS